LTVHVATLTLGFNWFTPVASAFLTKCRNLHDFFARSATQMSAPACRLGHQLHVSARALVELVERVRGRWASRGCAGGGRREGAREVGVERVRGRWASRGCAGGGRREGAREVGVGRLCSHVWHCDTVAPSRGRFREDSSTP
jgi:hypothetical protein